jgi:hypothetical protein
MLTAWLLLLPQALPSAAELLHKQFRQKKEVLQRKEVAGIMDKYGNAGKAPDSSEEALLLAAGEQYIEYDRHGRVLKGQEVGGATPVKGIGGWGVGHLCRSSTSRIENSWLVFTFRTLPYRPMAPVFVSLGTGALALHVSVLLPHCCIRLRALPAGLGLLRQM